MGHDQNVDHQSAMTGSQRALFKIIFRVKRMHSRQAQYFIYFYLKLTEIVTT